MQRIILLLVVFAGVAHGAADWDLRRLGGRDYVTIDNVADFYGLHPTEASSDDATDVTPASNRKTQDLSNARKQLQVKAGSREAIINGVKQWFAFPVREEEGHLLISRIDLAKTVEPMLRPQRVENLTPITTVVLDPGHGGHDRGAVNKLGDEKTYSLDVGKRLKSLLEEKGLNVVMTRDRDVFIPLQDRPKVANKIPNSIFVSIHFNSGGSHANGFEIFALTPRGAPSTADEVLRPKDFREEPGNAHDVQSAVLAASVYHSMLGHFADFDRGLKRARFAVIRLAEVPAVLIEGGFISNKENGESIDSEAWRQNLAESIAKGIFAFKGLSELRQPPELIADYRQGYGRPSWEGDSLFDLEMIARQIEEEEQAFTLQAARFARQAEPTVQLKSMESEVPPPAPKIVIPTESAAPDNEELHPAGPAPMEFFFEESLQGLEPLEMHLGMGSHPPQWKMTAFTAFNSNGAEAFLQDHKSVVTSPLVSGLAMLLLASGAFAFSRTL